MARKRQSPLEKSISAAWEKVPQQQRKKLVKVKNAILKQNNDVKRIRALIDIVSCTPDAGRNLVRYTGMLSTAYLSAIAQGFRRTHKNEYDALHGLAYAPKFVFQAYAAVSAADAYYSAISAGNKQVRRIKGSIASLEKECRRARRLTVLERNEDQIMQLEKRINALKASYRQLQKQYVKTSRWIKPVKSAREFYKAMRKTLDRKTREIKALELRIASLDVAYNRLEDTYESAVRRIRRGTGRREHAPRQRAPARERRARPARPAPARPYRRDTNLRRQYTEAQQEVQTLTYRLNELTNDYERLERTTNAAAQQATADLAEKDRKYGELQRNMNADAQRAQEEITMLNAEKTQLTGEKSQLLGDKQKLDEYLASLSNAHKNMQLFYAMAEEKVPADLNGAVEHYEKACKELQDHQDKFPDNKYEPFDVMIGLITRRIGDAYYFIARNLDESPDDPNRVEYYRKALAAYEKGICDTDTMARVDDCRAQIPAVPAHPPTPPPVPPGPATPPPVPPDAGTPPDATAPPVPPGPATPPPVPPEAGSPPPADPFIPEHF